MIFRINPETDKIEYLHGQRPRLGWAIQVGSPTARSFSSQDYWTTTPVTAIIEDTPERVLFKTKNSEYEWKP